ncbi:MAG: BREX system P-loop protein BrxC [Planctomycetes bacterium]|nr:BREX system P-loop protein BrxC [Planctomycetota bacterium]
MKNRELFLRDPAATRLVNDGQARIDETQTEKERQTLREELAHFVCEGQYKGGILRILESYLKHLSGSSQPAAWVSGFYGSGKSHLLKMLRHLWINTVFPEDGATARGLVPDLPVEIRDALRELDVQGKRCGGLRAAAGTLPAGGGSALRPTVLGIILRSAGLPESFPQARFCLYLRNNGFFERVKAGVEKAGKAFFRELNDLYVSPLLHDALIACDAGFRDRKSVQDLLRMEFPRREDISTAEFIQTIREVLAAEGQLPGAIIVLDEVQLFIADSSERATQVVEVAEALTKQLDSRLLLVGAGQTALSSTPLLQKLRDRFTIPVELSDADVESVIRRVLLAKRPDRVDAIRKCLETHSGEIDRQLAGSAIGPRAEDRDVLVDDYPLLPVRRRFWERVFRAVDVSGTHSQVRTQLRIVHEALQQLSEKPLGAVVPADFMFEQIQPGILQQGVLLREIDETIRRLDDGTADGLLKKRLCGLIFLIRKLPREKGADAGVRATASALADLLVSDLDQDGGRLRKETPRLLEALVEAGVLLNVDGEYNLQTRESAEWEKEFRGRQTRLLNNEHEIHGKRDALLRDAVLKALAGVRLQQGESREPRKIAPHFGEEPPEPPARDIPVWIRDEWSCSERDVLEAARAAGSGSPVAFVHLPKAGAEALRKRLVEAEAARSTIDFKGNPATAEGREARDAMRTRFETSCGERDETIRGIIDSAKVFKGGGEELLNPTFVEKTREAVSDALARLFLRFQEADHRNWGVAIQRARQGADSPLQAVDWTGPLQDHPVAREAMREIGPGKDGKSIRGALSESPFGWPQDAMDCILIALHAAGNLRARYKGTPVVPGQLDQGKIGSSDFQLETIALTANDKLAIRGLFQTAGIVTRPSDDLSEKTRQYLEALLGWARSAGGEPPLPESPDIARLEEIRGLSGNEQLLRILKDAIRLREDAERWRAAAELAALRLPAWRRLETFLRHAEGLPEARDLRSQAEAVRKGRLLLESTERVGPILRKAADLLRTAVTDALNRHREAMEGEARALEAQEAWRGLSENRRLEILAAEGIEVISTPPLGTDEVIERALETVSLANWREKTDALSQRYRNAALRAARLIEPEVRHVRLASGPLKTADDVKRWIAATERDLLAKIEKGPIVVG